MQCYIPTDGIFMTMRTYTPGLLRVHASDIHDHSISYHYNVYTQRVESTVSPHSHTLRCMIQHMHVYMIHYHTTRSERWYVVYISTLCMYTYYVVVSV